MRLQIGGGAWVAKIVTRVGPMSVNGKVRPCSYPSSNRILGRGAKDKEHAMSEKLESAIAVIGIDIGKTHSMLWVRMSAERSCFGRSGHVAR
jgi:hypothetical protein